MSEPARCEAMKSESVNAMHCGESTGEVLEREARILGRYLLREEPDSLCVELYAEAMEKRPAACDAQDERLLRLALRQPWTLGLLDGALALRKPNSALRQKLFTMIAILETRPAYAARFLSQERSFWYLFAALYFGGRGALKAIGGWILLKVV